MQERIDLREGTGEKRRRRGRRVSRREVDGGPGNAGIVERKRSDLPRITMDIYRAVAVW